MRVLIIGSTSVVGLSIGYAISKNHTVSFAGRRNADYFLDLASPDCKLPNDLRFDIVIHSAADFGGNQPEDMQRAEMINAIGTLNVCRLAQQVQAKHLIVVSTSFAVYTPKDPYYNAYSLSKRHADELAMLYCSRFNLPLTILRPSQIYDADSKCKIHQSLFYHIVERAFDGEDIVFYGFNDALRNYIFIDDVVEIVIKIMNKQILGLYYCSAIESIKLSDIAKIAYDVSGFKGQIIFDETKPSILDLTFPSGQELYSMLEYSPTISLYNGISRIKNNRKISCIKY